MSEELCTLRSAAQAFAAELSLTPAAAWVEARALARAVDGARADLQAENEPLPAAFAEFAQRRRRGEPVAYITGRREFFGEEFLTSPAALIPRSETELLAELALNFLPPDEERRVLELGAGGGALAVTIAKHRPRAQVLAADVCDDALALAKKNAARAKVENIRFLKSDWFGAVCGRFDLILCNPPYVADDDPCLRAGDLRFEPRRALAGGADGLDAARAVIAAAPDFLEEGGALMMEHGATQRRAVCAELSRRGFGDVAVYEDLAGLPRAVAAKIEFAKKA